MGWGYEKIRQMFEYAVTQKRNDRPRGRTLHPHRFVYRKSDSTILVGKSTETSVSNVRRFDHQINTNGVLGTHNHLECFRRAGLDQLMPPGGWWPEDSERQGLEVLCGGGTRRAAIRAPPRRPSLSAASAASACGRRRPHFGETNIAANAFKHRRADGVFVEAELGSNILARHAVRTS